MNNKIKKDNFFSKIIQGCPGIKEERNNKRVD